MKPPENMIRIYDRKRYSVATATLITGDDFWDGHNFERRGRNTWLYRTIGGAYFLVTLTQWQGEQDSLIPVSLEEAITMYEGSPNQWGADLTEHRETYAEAFPGVIVEDA